MIEVWAPAAKRVTLVLDDHDIEMEAANAGWHRAAADLEPGTHYAFSLDGADPLPDPRSRYQPDGPFGPSVVVEKEWRWSNDGWKPPDLKDWILYELHIGTFTPEGSFDAALDKLGHLLDLGVNAIELMPIAQGPGHRGWGYDCLNLYAVNSNYGGPDGFRRFVDGCHDRGMAVVVDVVYNHFGPGAEYLSRFGPYFARARTPWGSGPNLEEAASREVRSFLIENALMWLRDYRCDGLRLDAVHAIHDRSATHFLKELSGSVSELSANVGRPLVLIAESDLNDPKLLHEPERGGYGLHAQWSDDFHHALHARLTHENAGYYADFGSTADVALSLHRPFVFVQRYSRFHKKIRGRDPAGLSGDRFLAYLQNHDQIGNRTLGDRAGSYLSHGLLKLGAALVLTSPFVPMLFQGEEWAATTPFPYFTDHSDPGLGAAVRSGRLAEFAAFGWDHDRVPDPQSEATYSSAILRWDELSAPPHDDVLRWYRDLIALRRSQPALTDPDLTKVVTHYDEESGWLVVERGVVTIAANFSAAKVRVPLEEESRGDLLLTSGDDPERSGPDAILQPESVSIWLAER